MSNEFDYSGIYNQNAAQPGSTPPQAPQQPQAAQPAQPVQPQAAQPTQAAQPQAAQPAQPEQPRGTYPNVGSSGLNTANTMGGTAYTAPNPQPAQGGYTQPQQPTNNGYTSSFGGNGGNGGNGGGYNGYSYTSAPQQPPKKEKKKGSAKKVWLRVAACVGVAAIGFGGGIAGTVAATHLGLSGNQVVVQTVERSTDTAAIPQGSAGGETLSTQDVAAIVQPSVVAITTEQMTSSSTWFGGTYVTSGAGSGVIISEDGYILTCAHVVADATNITVKLNDDSEYTASIIGGDTTADIAVIKIEATGLTPAVIGDSDALAVGEEAIAVGNPLGMLGGSVTNGIISAVNRSVTVQNNTMTLIQTNASISPGNSGGGLFNANGELIGIVNAKSGYTDAEGLGFAIPINTAMEVAQALISDGYVKRPVLGVQVVTISDEQTALQYGVSAMGVYIASINEGSGAQAAGLQLGDRIVSIGDTAISTSNDLTNYLKDMSIGDTVTLQIEREGKIAAYDVVLGESTQS